MHHRWLLCAREVGAGVGSLACGALVGAPCTRWGHNPQAAPATPRPTATDIEVSELRGTGKCSVEGVSRGAEWRALRSNPVPLSGAGKVRSVGFRPGSKHSSCPRTSEGAPPAGRRPTDGSQCRPSAAVRSPTPSPVGMHRRLRHHRTAIPLARPRSSTKCTHPPVWPPSATVWCGPAGRHPHRRTPLLAVGVRPTDLEPARSLRAHDGGHRARVEPRPVFGLETRLVADDAAAAVRRCHHAQRATRRPGARRSRGRFTTRMEWFRPLIDAYDPIIREHRFSPEVVGEICGNASAKQAVVEEPHPTPMHGGGTRVRAGCGTCVSRSTLARRGRPRHTASRPEAATAM
jgi:hypothetical protein